MGNRISKSKKHARIVRWYAEGFNQQSFKVDVFERTNIVRLMNSDGKEIWS